MKNMWIVALAALTSGTALAQAPGGSALYARSLAATCANCHGTNGKALDGASVPGLAGVPRTAIVEKMRAFKSATAAAPGSGPTVMHQIAKGYSDEQIEELAAYFAAQPK